ncbi:MAG: suppressor of fused domain protein [Planctomycetota bacterium]
MFKRIFRWLGRHTDKLGVDEATADAWYEEKHAFLVQRLGAEHDMVMHALIPFAVGGTLDLYYFPRGIPGTAIATKELSELPGEGPSNRDFDNYELVMFTRQPIDLDHARDEDHPFGRMHRNLNGVLNLIARYAATATLNPYETCEFPEDMEGVGGKCLIFDAYPDSSGGRRLGLLAVIEIFRSEMEFKQEHGGQALLERLKEAGHYPYSDLDREPVA